MKLSIIIPTYNEANHINRTIGALLQRAVQQPLEIIVVDSGSMDGTIEAIRYPQVITITNPKLAGQKWRSLRMGANLAQGDVLLFLDADTLLPYNFDKAIEELLSRKKFIGGAFEFSFDIFSYSLWCITLVNRIRYRIRKRFYGDQAIFVKRDAYLKAGGWPDRSLLEAAYLCKSLQRYGRLGLIRRPVVTSSRRFTEGGVWKVFLHDIRIWGMDLLGMDVEKYGKAYWLKDKRAVSVKEVAVKQS
jgi:rSAM/selenodomain-associated transferase 2